MNFHLLDLCISVRTTYYLECCLDAELHKEFQLSYSETQSFHQCVVDLHKTFLGQHEQLVPLDMTLYCLPEDASDLKEKTQLWK